MTNFNVSPSSSPTVSGIVIQWLKNIVCTFVFQDGCSLVNGSPNNQHHQQQQQQQQLTLILLFGNHCRMAQSTQVK